MYPLTPCEPVAELVIRGTHFSKHCLIPLSNDWNIVEIFIAFSQTARLLQYWLMRINCQTLVRITISIYYLILKNYAIKYKYFQKQFGFNYVPLFHSKISFQILKFVMILFLRTAKVRRVWKHGVRFDIPTVFHGIVEFRRWFSGVPLAHFVCNENGN